MPEFQGPGPRPGWSPPPLKLSADAPFIGPVGPIVSGSQENLDLGIEGWHRGTSLLAQGAVPALIIALAQFNPQPVQAQIFKSQPAAPVVAAAPSTFVSGSQQRYVDSIGQVFASIRAGGTPTTPEWVSASPQADPSQSAATVFKSQPAAPVAASPVAEFFSVPPESVDLSIEGWHRGTSLLAQGAVPALTAARQDVTDPIQGSVWPPARTQPVASSAVPATIYASPPDTRQLAAQVWRSATTQPVSGVIPEFTQAAPELVDLGIEGWHRGVSLLAQGGVPQLIAAYSIPDTKQTANIWPSVRTPPAAASGDIVKPVFASPQYPPYVAAVTWGVAVSPQGPGSSAEYRFGSHAIALHAAESIKSRLFSIGPFVPLVSGKLGTLVQGSPQLADLTLPARVVPSAITQPVQGAVPTTIRGAPQLVDLTLPARIIPSAITQPVQGPVPPLVSAGQPQQNPSQLPAQLWTPLEFGVAPPPPVEPGTATPGRILLPGRTVRVQRDVEPEDEKRARRIREGIIRPEVAPVAVVAPPVIPDAQFYSRESARLSSAIEKSRAESTTIRRQIAELEARQQIETLRAAERQKIEKRLTRATQELQMAQLQEAIILEQMEVIDVAYVALIALAMTQQ